MEFSECESVYAFSTFKGSFKRTCLSFSDFEFELSDDCEGNKGNYDFKFGRQSVIYFGNGFLCSFPFSSHDTIDGLSSLSLFIISNRG